jgi:hypothetical protein
MGYPCKTCGAWHEERPTCFIAELPLYVLQIPEDEREKRVLQGPEQCVVDEQHFFIRANLDVPLRGSAEFLRWTVWTTLSAANFRRATDLWNAVGRESEQPYFGRLSNQIQGYSQSVSIKTMVHTQEVGVPPKIEIIDEAHVLRTDQQYGITAERADELIHAALHQEHRPQ